MFNVARCLQWMPANLCLPMQVELPSVLVPRYDHTATVVATGARSLQVILFGGNLRYIGVHVTAATAVLQLGKYR